MQTSGWPLNRTSCCQMPDATRSDLSHRGVSTASVDNRMIHRSTRLSASVPRQVVTTGALPTRLAALTAKAATAATAATIANRRHRPRLVDRQVPPAVLMLVELADRTLGALCVAHLDERKPARLAGRPVTHDVDGGHRTG